MKRSDIGWTDYSAEECNFIIGCHRVSPGCAHCYGYEWARKFNWNGGKFEEVKTYPDKLKQLAKARLASGEDPFRRGPGSRPMVFVVDLGDLFHEQVPADFIHQAFEVMASRPDVDFQVLTKRPQRMVEVLGSEELPAHIWVGVTAETRAAANERIPLLRRINAAVRFVSVEPMLEPISLNLTGISWVICGGESGASRRPFAKSWGRSLLGQCRQAGVPFFFKQGSALRPGQDDLLEGQRVKEWPV